MDGDTGGGMALLRDRFGEGYDMLSEMECSMGEKGKRSWEATVDKVSRACDPASLVLESLPHLLFRDRASASALDSVASRSSAYGSELSTKTTAERSVYNSEAKPVSVPTVFGNSQPYAILVKRVLVRIEPLQIPTTFGRLGQVFVHRGILLMAKYNALTGATLSATFATL